MPRENKNRGRREEKKLKRKAETIENVRVKRQKAKALLDELEVEITGTDNAPQSTEQDVEMGGVQEEEVTEERPFYGMLEDEEQEYFRRADELLELNDFPSPEERSIFLENVYREAEGKELKLACSQSCSRLMERLILMSTVEQKKKLFGKFEGNFAHLVQHRFASHCVEMLVIKSAGVVTEELTGEEGNGETMESLFLKMLDELEGNMTFLLTDRFASHTLRVLLVILSGRPLEQTSTQTLLQSKKKEKISITNLDTTPTELTLSKRAVPESFSFAVQKIISDTIATMDESFIRVLATHPTGNPTLQLLLELELTSKVSKSKDAPKTILATLLPDDIGAEGSQSAVFVNGLLYDAIGSRLLETIMTFSPGKTFKNIYRTIFKDRIAGLARNEIASYVVIRVLNRLSKEDLEEAITAMLPQITGLVQRNRTVIIKTLIERCHARSANLEPLTQAISTAYGSDPSSLILKMVCIDDLPTLTAAVLPPQPTSTPTTSDIEPKQPQQTIPIPRPSPPQLHGSLLAQSLFSIPGPPQKLLQEALLTLSPTILLTLALYTPTSHILQSALIPSDSNLTFRRKFITTLLFPQNPSTSTAQTPIISLALSNTGTHILDSLLPSSTHLFPLLERVALTLAQHENELRDSFMGRIVWRNWAMDLFGRRRGEWVKKIRGEGAQAASLSGVGAGDVRVGVKEMVGKGDAVITKDRDKKVAKEKGIKGKDRKDTKRKNGKEEKENEGGSTNSSGKTAIQLARERYSVEKGKKDRMKGSKGTGANGIVA